MEFSEFEVTADADPGLLPRALATLALQNAVPESGEFRRDGDVLVLTVRAGFDSAVHAELVRRKLLQIGSVHRVDHRVVER